jgi:hypothetical protein
LVAKHCTKTGILPFGIGYHSDHRAVFVWIKFQNILSTTVNTIDTIMARKLIQATPKEREVFIEEVHRYLDNQNIYNRLQALKTTETWTESEIAEYNSCDDIIIHGMLIAEKRARKIKTMAWSPIFGTAVQKKLFWKIALSLKQNCKRPNDKIIQWAESLSIDEFTTLDMAAIQTNLRKAQKELREIEKQADAL